MRRILSEWVLLSILLIIFMLAIGGCSDNPVQPVDENVAALTEIASTDSTVKNFEANYDDGSTGIAAKIAAGWVTLDVSRKINSVERNFAMFVLGDSAKGVVTLTFNMTLRIRAKKDSTSTSDTVLTKNYISVVKRNLLFMKVNSTPNPKNNWKLMAWSSPEGGVTSATGHSILALNVIYNGETIMTVTSPNETYLERGTARYKQLPIFDKNSVVMVVVSVLSNTDDPDWLILNYGADNKGVGRNKVIFTLQSVVSAGEGKFVKTYTAELVNSNVAGYYHLVVDALTKKSVADDSTPVESKVWALPYGVKNN